MVNPSLQTQSCHRIINTNTGRNACGPSALASSCVENGAHSLDSRRRSRSTGLTNFSQSCVPLGTMRSSCSATTMPSAYDRLVLLMVVMKSEPPGCKTNRGKENVSVSASDFTISHHRGIAAVIARCRPGHRGINRRDLKLSAHENRKNEGQAWRLNRGKRTCNRTGKWTRDRKWKKAEPPSKWIGRGISAQALLRQCPGGRGRVLIPSLFLATKQK